MNKHITLTSDALRHVLSVWLTDDDTYRVTVSPNDDLFYDGKTLPEDPYVTAVTSNIDLARGRHGEPHLKIGSEGSLILLRISRTEALTLAQTFELPVPLAGFADDPQPDEALS